MTPPLTRRTLIAGAPVAAAGLLSGCVTAPSPAAAPAELYRSDDPAALIAAVKAIATQDYVATLITLDDRGVPRARSVGVSDPEDDLVFWIGTRRTSRKVGQIRNNQVATLHFARDNLAQNMAGASYASLMGRASVHTDPQTLTARGPSGEIQKAFWPNFPDDFAAIRFETHWLEVTGNGIKGDEKNWQPQALILPAER